MECQNCAKEMESEVSTVDQFDPFRGHYQYEGEVWYCEECSHVEPYIDESDYELDAKRG